MTSDLDSVFDEPPPTTWMECQALLRRLPADALVVAAEEAARSVLHRWPSADDAPARALEAVAGWRAAGAEPEALKGAATAAYHAAHVSEHAPGSAERSAGFAAAHAAFAAFFHARGGGKQGEKVFEAARDACSHASRGGRRLAGVLGRVGEGVVGGMRAAAENRCAFGLRACLEGRIASTGWVIPRKRSRMNLRPRPWLDADEGSIADFPIFRLSLGSRL